MTLLYANQQQIKAKSIILNPLSHRIIRMLRPTFLSEPEAKSAELSSQNLGTYCRNSHQTNIILLEGIPRTQLCAQRTISACVERLQLPSLKRALLACTHSRVMRNEILLCCKQVCAALSASNNLFKHELSVRMTPSSKDAGRV